MFSKIVFQRQFSIFLFKPEVDFKNKNVKSSHRSNLNIYRLNFENPSISSQDMSKKSFPVQTGSRFSAIFFLTSLRSNVNICGLNFQNPSISSQDMSKKSFPVQTGSKFSAAKIFYHHFDQTWTYAIWISKIRLLVLRIWAKSLFPSKLEEGF